MNQENLEVEPLLNLSQNLAARQLLKNPLLQKDVWRTNVDLGLKVNGHRQQLTINFTIQHTLRHRTPEMLKHYVSRNKKVLSAEIEELMKKRKYVNIEGKIVDVYRPKNPVEELIRRKMYQVTTQYGECHRSVLQAPCHTVNACWRCEHWRTTNEDLPHLLQDLERVEKELKIVKREGLIKLEQGLEGDSNNIKNCIEALEKVSD